MFYDARRKPVRTLDGDANDLTAAWDGLGRIIEVSRMAQMPWRSIIRYTAQNALGKIALVTYTGGSQQFD